MKYFKINNKKVEFDETKTYLDFFLVHGKKGIYEVKFDGMLSELESGKISLDENLKKELYLLRRWTKEAPRKRFYRELKLKGMNVVSGEEFFVFDKGEEIINNLENTGKFADYFICTMFEYKEEEIETPAEEDAPSIPVE